MNSSTPPERVIMLARDRRPLPRSFLAGAPSPSRKLEGDNADDIVLVRTGWSDRAFGEFPRYYVDSPTCSPEAAEWLVAKGCRAIGFDCFPEASAKKTDYSPDEFVVHRTIGEGGAVLMQTLTNLDALPRGQRFQFFAPFLKFEGAEGVPARFFAVV
jgi:arylformamidase